MKWKPYNPEKKTRKAKRLTHEIKALEAAAAEKEETISAMRSAAPNTSAPDANPLERPTQGATINGRAQSSSTEMRAHPDVIKMCNLERV